MSRFLRTAELAVALGVQNASITMALKNGKLERERDKSYDIERAVNKIWIGEQVAKGKVFDLSRLYQKQTEKVVPKQTEGGEVIKKSKAAKEPTISEAENDNYYKKKRALELKKAKNQILLDELKIQKIKGELIPYSAVKTVFLYAAETFRSTYLQEVDALSNVFLKRLGGGHEHFVELQKALQEKINDIQATVKDDLLQGLKGIQAEYEEVRGRGERK